MRAQILVYGKVTASCLNVRCGPGISYNRVGKLYKGDYVDVFAKVGGWYIIKADDDLVGAVSSDYLEAVYNEEERYSNVEQESSEERIEEKNTSSESEENLNNTENAVDSSSESVENNKSEEEINTDDNNLNDNSTTQEVISEEFANSEELTKDEQEFLDLINANREANGLKALEVDPEVQNVARLKAKDLVDNNYFAHTSETYGDIQNMLNTFEISYTSAGENIAGDSSLAKAVEAWMNSENHKVNILSENYNYTGIAIEESKDYGKIFVEVFIQK